MRLSELVVRAIPIHESDVGGCCRPGNADRVLVGQCSLEVSEIAKGGGPSEVRCWRRSRSESAPPRAGARIAESAFVPGTPFNNWADFLVQLRIPGEFSAVHQKGLSPAAHHLRRD